MRRAERLFRLINEMRASKVTRACDLAMRLEVSPSTIYRDIAHLQASGLPIDGEAGVGYMLRQGFDLPNITLSFDQIDALAVGLSFVQRIGDDTLARAASDARAKLQAALPSGLRRTLTDAPFASLHFRPEQDISAIRDAIHERTILRLRYQDAQNRSSRRTIRPLVLTTYSEGWLVSGWCELREGFRTFRSDRIVALAQTGTYFEDEADKNLKTFWALQACEYD